MGGSRSNAGRTGSESDRSALIYRVNRINLFEISPFDFSCRINENIASGNRRHQKQIDGITRATWLPLPALLFRLLLFLYSLRRTI